MGEAAERPSETPGVLPWRSRPFRDTRGFHSPAVRRLLAERGFDPLRSVIPDVRGTGAGGRVTRDDILAALASGAPVETDDRSDLTVPFNRVRRRAAAALLRSVQTTAPGLCVVAADYSAVDATRLARRNRWREEEGFSLTYLPFVARAVVDALQEHPRLNATVTDDAVVLHHDVGLGVAVDLDHEGLVVPVVRDAGSLTLRAVARAVDDLAGRARGRRLQPDDVAGVTFTITNPGAAGTWISVPIIHQPAVAILSTDGVRARVVAHGSDLAVRPVGHLCLSFDQRAVDAVDAASFLGRVRSLLETRDWAAEV